MKSIIYCADNSVKWIRDNFSCCSPYLLEIGNKPFLEYIIDFCVLAKIKKIRIVQDEHDERVQEQLGNGERWNIELSYATALTDSPIDSIIRYNRGFVGDDQVMIFKGMFWLKYDKRSVVPVADCFSGNIMRTTSAGDGWYLAAALAEGTKDHMFVEDNVSDSTLPGVAALDSIMSFFQRNMTLLNGDSIRYNLPGYGADKKNLIGQNVVIPRSAKIVKPVIIGDCVQLGQHTKIGPGVIIGSNSLIDNNTDISNSVVINNSYIGCNLELKDKIAAQNIVINPHNGTRLDITDEFLLTPVDKRRKILCTPEQRLAALFLVIIWVLPWLLMRPWSRLRTREISFNSGLHRLTIKRHLPPGKNFIGRWFFKFSLDRFHLLGKVITGKLRLVGNIILDDSSLAKAGLDHSAVEYKPGLFSYSDALGHGQDLAQCRIDEFYYLYHAGFRFNVWILYKTLTRNFFKET
ncbi:MAG: NDP-sugar synthase [Victivallaceae bacterium]|nr:NDP-sugar synthase [Victivallaceae bacterium]